jgi:hypothetical protein
MNRTVTEKEAVLNVFGGLIGPLMRLAFEYGISAGEIAGVVRRAYIQALEARLKEQKRPTTDSRLAVVAGLPKSDVSALRDALRAGAPHSLRRVSMEQIQRLLTAWHTNSAFSGAYGLPLDLDLSPVQGSPRKNFGELVATACPGVDPEALLDELVAARSVEVIDGATARCLSRAYVPGGEHVTRIERMGRNLRVIVSNYVHNIMRTDDEPGYFERLVVSDEKLSESGRDEFLAVSTEKAQELLGELDTFLTRLGASDGDPGSGKKYGMGIYFFEEGHAEGIAEPRVERTARPSAQSSKSTAVEEIDVLAAVKRKE